MFVGLTLSRCTWQSRQFFLSCFLLEFEEGDRGWVIYFKVRLPSLRVNARAHTKVFAEVRGGEHVPSCPADHLSDAPHHMEKKSTPFTRIIIVVKTKHVLSRIICSIVVRRHACFSSRAVSGIPVAVNSVWISPSIFLIGLSGSYQAQRSWSPWMPSLCAETIWNSWSFVW